MKATVTLIIIYNHRYDKNIEILEKIYANRFSNIVHIVPFYNGSRPNVIPVYENSFYFQGYLAQAFNRYYKSETEHYFFVADDMMINPLINENTYKEHLNLSSETSYFPEFINLSTAGKWKRTQDAVEYNPRKQGVEIGKEIPSYEEARAVLAHAGFDIKPLNYKDVYTTKKRLLHELSTLKGSKSYKDVFKVLKHHYTNTLKSDATIDLPYPLVGGYSDIFIVSGDSIQKFIHYCGVFSATDLFVELAIPTALLLSSTHIRTEQELSLKGKAMWTSEDFKLIEPYNYNLKSLMDNFPANHLYLHPIKLSKWQTAI